MAKSYKTVLRCRMCNKRFSPSEKENDYISGYAYCEACCKKYFEKKES